MKNNQKPGGYASLLAADGENNTDPLVVIKDFFSWYSPDEAGNELLDLLLAALSSEEATNWGAWDRGRFVFLYRQLTGLIGAVSEDYRKREGAAAAAEGAPAAAEGAPEKRMPGRQEEEGGGQVRE